MRGLGDYGDWPAKITRAPSESSAHVGMQVTVCLRAPVVVNFLLDARRSQDQAPVKYTALGDDVFGQVPHVQHAPSKDEDAEGGVVVERDL